MKNIEIEELSALDETLQKLKIILTDNIEYINLEPITELILFCKRCSKKGLLDFELIKLLTEDLKYAIKRILKLKKPSSAKQLFDSDPYRWALPIKSGTGATNAKYCLAITYKITSSAKISEKPIITALQVMVHKEHQLQWDNYFEKLNEVKFKGLKEYKNYDIYAASEIPLD